MRAQIRCDLQLAVIVDQQDIQLFATKKAAAGFKNLFENRLGVFDRLTDDTQDFRAGLLLLKRVFDLGRALLHLVKEPRVADGNDGLCGKGLHQRDLLGRKG